MPFLGKSLMKKKEKSSSKGRKKHRLSGKYVKRDNTTEILQGIECASFEFCS